jgi:RHS repeat-associated protein
VWCDRRPVGLSLRRSSLLALVLISTAASASAADKSGVKPQVLSLPSGPGSIEGLGESFEPQLNTGAAPYQVKLAVPPGIAGHQPALALSYSSGTGNGQFGIGWSLSVPAIQRHTDKGQPRYAAGDVFIFSNGEELVPLADAAQSWRAENEADFMRFQRVGEGWEARDRSGRLYRFGSTAASRVEHDGSGFERTFKWYVDAFEDTNGNRVDFFYTTYADSPGERFVTEVRYNGQERGGPYNSVAIDYEPRPDAFTDYRARFKICTARRGSRIRMLSAGSLVREYVLSYDADRADILEADPRAVGAVPLAVSLLSAVTQYDRAGSAGGNYLPPLRFTYTRLFTADRDNPPAGNFPGTEDVDLNGNGRIDGAALHALDPAPVSESFLDGDVDFLDVDGDSLPDVLTTEDGQHGYYRNLGRNRFSPGSSVPISGGPGIPVSGDGAALADLDGDGRADFAHFPGGEDDRLRLYRIQADGGPVRWSEAAVFDNAPPFGLNGPRVQLLDLDFDKAIDAVYSLGNDSWQVCLNSGTGDVDYPPFGNFPGAEDVDRNAAGVLDAGAWSCGNRDMPFDADVVFGEPGADVQLADMNGDRLQDVVYLQATSDTARAIRYWPNMGRGDFDQKVPMLADGGTGGEIEVGPLPSTGTQPTLKVVDVTGDGLADLVRVDDGVVRLWSNADGRRWSAPAVFHATPPYRAGETTLRMADMNGNGTIDVVWINVEGPAATRWQYLDFTALGKPNQLHIIDNGLGRRITIEYKSSTDDYVEAREKGNPWKTVSPFPMQVVSRVVVTPGLDLDGDRSRRDEYVTEFVYRDAYYDGYEKEFRGFGFVKKIERGDGNAPTKVTRIAFHTGAPDEVDNDGDDAVDERSEAGGAEEEPLKGRVLRQEVSDAGGGADSVAGDGRNAAEGVTFTRTLSDWRIRALHSASGGSRGIATLPGEERAVSFAFDRQDDTFVIERDQAGYPPVQLRTSRAYDDFGNVIEERHEGALSRAGDERYLTTEYRNDTERWIVDKPAHAMVTDAAGAKVTETYSYYDGPCYVGLPQGVERGNLTRERSWVEGGDYIDSKRNCYDDYGNVVGLLDPLGDAAALTAGHAREIVYDPTFHTFPVLERIHVGGGTPPLEMRADYDLGFGVMTASTEFNGHRTTYRYDSFGRLTSIIKPGNGDSELFPTALFEYRMADPERGLLLVYDRQGALTAEAHSPTASSVTTRAREQAGESGTFDTVQYVDGMGRKLASVEEAEQGFAVKEAVLFNARGTVRDTFQPYHSGLAEAEYPPPSPDDPNKSVTRYDATGRQIVLVNPPDEKGVVSDVLTDYRPLRRTVLDELRNEHTYIVDGLPPVDDENERLIEVQEVNGGEPYLTRYTYNPADSLLGITDAQDNVTTFSYDGLQRKVFLDHVDRGAMSYAYDAASNLIETVDAKGQRITYEYDGVNRILAEDYHDAANRSPDIGYHYDAPAGAVDAGDNTRLTAANLRGQLAWVEDLSGEEHLCYDARGRTVWTIKRVVDPLIDVLTSFKTAMSYDSLDRMTELIYPDNDRVRYEYNRRSLVERISGGPSGCIVCDVDYRDSGQQARVEYGNGVVTTYAYDPRLRLTELQTVSAGQVDLIHYKYSFDQASNIERIDDMRPASVVAAGDPRRNTQQFTYDGLYRLTRVDYSFAPDGSSNDGFIEYDYDQIGNMLRQTSDIVHEERGRSVTNHGEMIYGLPNPGTCQESTGKAGREGRVGRAAGDAPGPHALTATHGGATPFCYDDNGNMTTLDGMRLSWDFKDRLVGVDNSSPALAATYTYDHTDQRISKKVTPRSPRPGFLNLMPPSAVFYPSRYFEVREHDQPIKYVFVGNTRVAEITGSIDSGASRIQRFRLRPGWNLLALAVDAPQPAAQFGLERDDRIEAVYRWNQATARYALLSAADAAPAGSVLWVKAAQSLQVQVEGTYREPESIPVSAGGALIPGPGLLALSLARARPQMVTDGWLFDAWAQRWALSLAPQVEGLAFLQEGIDFVPAGGALFVDAVTAGELILPPIAQRIRYYHQDHLGSLNVLADAEGAVLQASIFYPYGHLRRRDEMTGESAVRGGRYLFSQKEMDAESDLHYLEARYYAPKAGVFLSVDPVVGKRRHFGSRLNGYRYALANPVGFSDPDGQEGRRAQSLTLVVGGWEGPIEQAAEKLDPPTGFDKSMRWLAETTAEVSGIRSLLMIMGDRDILGGPALSEQGAGAILQHTARALNSLSGGALTRAALRPVGAYLVAPLLGRAGAVLTKGAQLARDRVNFFWNVERFFRNFSTTRVIDWQGGQRFFRAFGGDAALRARWVTSGVPDRALHAVPPGNTMRGIAEYVTKPGAEYYSGGVAAAFGQPGGGGQAFFPNPFGLSLLRAAQSGEILVK